MIKPNRSATWRRRLDFRQAGSGLAAAVGGLILSVTGVQAAPLDEITVSARRTDENLQDVPVAVTPFTAELIEDLNLQSIDDIALFTPGFSFTSAFGRQPGSDRPAMRGISTVQNGIANASAVSYFIDGVYLGGSPQATELSNVERVEVLRGPQAAALGRGTYIGAINFITRRPTDEFAAFADVTAGQDGLFNVTGNLSGPLTDTLGFFVAAGSNSFDGQYTNQRTGTDLGGQESLDLTTKLFWTPTDNFDAVFKVGYQETDDDHFPIYLQPRIFNNCCFRDPVTSPRSREYYIGEARADPNRINLVTDILDQAGGSGVEVERLILSTNINWTFADDMTLSVLGGYIDDEIQTGFDVSYAGYDPVPFGIAAGQFWQIDRDEQSDASLEIRLTSSRDRAVRWTVGGYYYNGKTSEKATNRVISDGMGGFVAVPLEVADLTDEEIENFAVFGGIDWDVTDKLTLGVEARYAEDEITVRNFSNDPRDEPAIPFGSFLEQFDGKFTSFTPRVTAVYAFSDDVNFYGNISKGTKPGDFNSNVPSDPVTGEPLENLREVDEEIAWNYEVGAKTTLLDGRANFNVAFYYLDVSDQQLTQVFEIPGGGGITDSLLQNVGETAVRGLELESVFDLTDNWRGGLTYAYTDAKITKRISADQAELLGSDGSLEQELALGNVAGKRVPRIPQNQFSVWTRYDRAFGNNRLWYVSADYAYEGSKFAQEHNLIETGNRNIVGARAGIVIDNWEFELWGRNIFDEDAPVDIIRYIDRRFGTFPPGNGSTSPRGFGLTLPLQRQIGVSARYRFGG
ncbi:MAG: TonB-dependent receptor [Gammaproteobacteria bacterium]|jgi:outer membrane receptor protein involved in Fe transport|nr:TonB-dependent receptor [Gammaproteobacteria bacterium]